MTDTECANAIVELLALYPDCEMRVPDVWGELNEKWDKALIETTLQALVAARSVAVLNHDGVPWYSIAIQKLDASQWSDGAD